MSGCYVQEYEWWFGFSLRVKDERCVALRWFGSVALRCPALRPEDKDKNREAGSGQRSLQQPDSQNSNLAG